MYHLVFVVGFCSDGEFNSLRNRGYTRPLSLFAVRSDVRSKYSRMSISTMKAMLTSKGWEGGVCGVVVVCLAKLGKPCVCLLGTLLCPFVFCSLCRWTN